ncbi:MAG: hypothetical protein ACOVN4_13210, partial [Bosea sp. (in: a-proteobacteria)]
MGISTTNADLFRAILAMDAYNRGYNAGIKSPNAGPDQGLTGTMIGLASVGTASSSALNSPERNASFFAQAYSLGGKTVISYRGTDAAWDAASGWVNGGGAA